MAVAVLEEDARISGWASSSETAVAWRTFDFLSRRCCRCSCVVQLLATTKKKCAGLNQQATARTRAPPYNTSSECKIKVRSRSTVCPPQRTYQKLQQRALFRPQK